VEVTDSGIGFAAGDQLKVLGEFSQFKRSELEGGGSIRMNFSHVNCNIFIYTLGGLGLSLCLSRRIIDKHQVSMTYEYG